ncbi:MAG: lytic murein transglycosylase [Paracoccus aminovorans]|nr:lytic murein transglycosylase [Paracoccus aminovorans]
MTRRISRIALGAILIASLAGCGVSMNRTPGAPGGNFAGLPTAGGQGSESGFQTWVASFRPRALAAGISGATFDRAMADAHFMPSLIALDRKQSEFAKPVWDYLDGAIGTRGATGRSKAAQYSSTLAAIEIALRRPARGGAGGLGHGIELRRGSRQYPHRAGPGDAGL